MQDMLCYMVICKAPLTGGYSEEATQRDRLVKIKVHYSTLTVSQSYEID